MMMILSLLYNEIVEELKLNVLLTRILLDVRPQFDHIFFFPGKKRHLLNEKRVVSLDFLEPGIYIYIHLQVSLQYDDDKLTTN